jgi:hypothetical protein
MKKITGLMGLIIINQGLIKQASPTNGQEMSPAGNQDQSFLRQNSGKLAAGSGLVVVAVGCYIKREEIKKLLESKDAAINNVTTTGNQDAKDQSQSDNKKDKLTDAHFSTLEASKQEIVELKKKAAEKKIFEKEIEEYYKQNKNIFFRYNLKNNDGNFTHDYYYKIFLPYALNLDKEQFSLFKTIWAVDDYFYQLSLIKNWCDYFLKANGDDNNLMKNEFKQLCKEFKDVVGVTLNDNYDDQYGFQLENFKRDNPIKDSFKIIFTFQNKIKNETINTNPITLQNYLRASSKENPSAMDAAKQLNDWLQPLTNKIKTFMETNVENFLTKHQDVYSVYSIRTSDKENLKTFLTNYKKQDVDNQKILESIMNEINNNKNFKDKVTSTIFNANQNYGNYEAIRQVESFIEFCLHHSHIDDQYHDSELLGIPKGKLKVIRDKYNPIKT